MRPARRWRVQLTIAFVAAVALVRPNALVIQQRAVSADAAAIKLTTILKDVAATVAQDVSDPLRRTPAAGLPVDIATLPKSLQDAARSSHLRMNDSGEIQVYILMSGV